MKEEKNADIFPKHFFWGASTAAHQVEGYNHNQWSVWELENAARLAQTAHIRLSWLPKWERFKNEAEEPDNYVSGKGIDHYNRYKEDFDFLQRLNLNSFRFTIEWSRIEPEEGKFNEEEIKHYQTYIKELRKRKLEPFLNIWHWTFPVWFAEKGGFEKRTNLKYFKRFIQKVSEELIEEVEYVITLNEPNVYAGMSYLTGEHVPEKKNALLFMRVYMNLTKAHKEAYKILKNSKPSLQVGVAAQLANIQAKRPHNIFDELVTQVMRYSWNWWFINRIKKYQDFLGINYYFTDYYKIGLGKQSKLIKQGNEVNFPGLHRENPATPVSDLGFYMEPEGLYPLLVRAWAHYKKPIFITENGLADSEDSLRRWWIESTIVAMERALSEGVDLRGYFHWSLLDNFEWAYGWWPEFGLVHIDRKKGMKRTIRPSAKWLADWIAKLD